MCFYRIFSKIEKKNCLFKTFNINLISPFLSFISSDHSNGTVPSNLTALDFESGPLNLEAINNYTNEDAIKQCWQSHNLTRLQVYRLFLVGFTVIFGPFVAFSVQKTKYLQIITVIFRWCGKY